MRIRVIEDERHGPLGRREATWVLPELSRLFLLVPEHVVQPGGGQQRGVRLGKGVLCRAVGDALGGALVGVQPVVLDDGAEQRLRAVHFIDREHALYGTVGSRANGE